MKIKKINVENPFIIKICSIICYDCNRYNYYYLYYDDNRPGEEFVWCRIARTRILP